MQGHPRRGRSVLTVPAVPDPALPPLLTGHAVAAEADPAEAAFDGAADGRYAAGDVCWSGAETHAVAAIVLEPECPLAVALQMAPLLLVAIGDALGSIGPPNLAITYRWPAGLLANGGDIGRVSLRAPACALLDEPDYIVVGFSIAMSLPEPVRSAPGRDTTMTALFEEGCGDLDRTLVIEAVARHFLSWLDGWQQDGFKSARPVLEGRLQDVGDRVTVPDGAGIAAGRLIGIGDDGRLLLDGDSRMTAVSLAAGLGFGEPT